MNVREPTPYRPQVEGLERRELLDASGWITAMDRIVLESEITIATLEAQNNLNIADRIDINDQVRWRPSDVSQLAAMFPRHEGPTILYLNFDGWTANGVTAFASTTGDRVRDIHEILFRTAQVFAPFDVQVQQITGDGAHATSGGHSTIFIGNNTANGTGANDVAHAYCPWENSDFPGTVLGTDHRPNSNAFDVAYVDPVGAGNGAFWNNLQIAQAVAHEAGHTFGLAHVLTAPADETMSYDDTNARFINQSFNLTDLNWTGTQFVNDARLIPTWQLTAGVNVPMVTQNSYAYLQATLGLRNSLADLANVADASTVDTSVYGDGWRPALYAGYTGNSFSDQLDRAGDFDVFTYTAVQSESLRLEVNGQWLDTVAMVFDASGQNLVAHNDDGAGAGLNSRLNLWVSAGQTIQIVVGSYGGNGAGAYDIRLIAELSYGNDGVQRPFELPPFPYADVIPQLRASDLPVLMLSDATLMSLSEPVADEPINEASLLLADTVVMDSMLTEADSTAADGYWTDTGFWTDAGYWDDVAGVWVDQGFWTDGGYWTEM